MSFGGDGLDAFEGEEAEGAFGAAVVNRIVVAVAGDAQFAHLGFEDRQLGDAALRDADLDDRAGHGASRGAFERA
jgi:hypothetical protein